jgi:hypothetical protein
MDNWVVWLAGVAVLLPASYYLWRERFLIGLGVLLLIASAVLVVLLLNHSYVGQM